jgi:hypothetical protein
MDGKGQRRAIRQMKDAKNENYYCGGCGGFFDGPGLRQVE